MELLPRVVGPLNFKSQSNISIYEKLFPTKKEINCLVCDKRFKFYIEKHEYLKHLYIEHRLIIGDEQQVDMLHEYLIKWREYLAITENKIFEFCTKIILNQLPDGTASRNVTYYLLCDVSPKDYELRQELRNAQLELVLAMHKFERTDDEFEKNCLFCRDMIKSSRWHFIEHLFKKHFLQLGKPENLVFIDELIDTLQAKLENLVCIFCEKKFKDRTILKEHMRKKGHKRINPENTVFDKFFLVNYQRKKQIGYKKKDTEDETIDDITSIEDIFSCDSNWSEWKGETQEVICLFCSQKNRDFIWLKSHIHTEHGIDFDQETEDTTFYDRVKIVNFVRRKMFMLQCTKCDQRFSKFADLQTHLKNENHYSLGQRRDWDLPQYFFPTYEDDAFLCNLEDFNTDDDIINANEGLSIKIYAEDSSVSINLDAEALSKEHMEAFEK